MSSAEKPHLLFSAFAEVPGPGSLGTRVYQLVTVFSDDFDVDGITLKGKDLSHIQRLGTARMLRVPVEGKPFLERLASFQRALQRQLTGDSYQLVYCADLFSAQIAAAYRESRGFSLVVEVNDLPSESFTSAYPIDAPTPALRQSWRDMEGQALRAADVVIAPSRHAAKKLSTMVDPRRIQLLARAVDLGVFHPTVGELETAGPPVVVVVGRRVAAGERAAALAILAELASSLPEGAVRLFLAGQSGLGEETMHHELVLSGLVGRVESVELDSPVRLANALTEATVVVVPTKAESGIEPLAPPHRVLEAMACRRATVVTGASETLAEMLVPGREAVVVQGGAPREVARAVLRLIESPAERMAIATAAHARVVEQADLQRRLAEFSVIITEATGVRMTPRTPESTVRGEWSASGAFSPDGFASQLGDDGPALIGPSLVDERVVPSMTALALGVAPPSGSEPSGRLMPAPSADDAAPLVAAPLVAAPLVAAPLVDGARASREPPPEGETAGIPRSPGPTELAKGGTSSQTKLLSKPPLTSVAPSGEGGQGDDDAEDDDQWGGETAIEPDGAFDSSAPDTPAAPPAPVAAPSFRALADADGDSLPRLVPPSAQERPPPLPPKQAPPESRDTPPPLPAARARVDDAKPARDAPTPASRESDPFLSTGKGHRPEPARPPTDMRPSLDKTAHVAGSPGDRAPTKATIHDPQSARTSTAEPWPANLGPVARGSLDDQQATELFEHPRELVTDLPGPAGSPDPWAPDTVFDAVPLFPSGERPRDASQEASAASASSARVEQQAMTVRAELASTPSSSAARARATASDSSSIPRPRPPASFLVDEIAAERHDDRAGTAPIVHPVDDSGAHAVRGDVAPLERQSTEPHRAPEPPTSSASVPSTQPSLSSSATAGRAATLRRETPVVDDEDLFSDAEPGGSDPDLTLEDMRLPTKPASAKP